MNDAMIRECKLHGYTGFQFDFENIDWTDRDNLTKLVQVSAAALHQAGLQLTIATVPNAPGYPGAGGFSKWIFTDWRGSFDIAELAKYVDLICLMTYDQHTRWTMPGPVAGWDWTVENLNYALKVVPKERLSLGIPLLRLSLVHRRAHQRHAFRPGKAQSLRQLYRHSQCPPARGSLQRQNPMGR